SRLARWRDSDLLANFLRSKTAVAALIATVLMVGLAFASPWIAPQNPYDPAQLDLINSNLPPIWQADGQAPYYLGTDDQGRDVLSAVLYGLRLSLIVGVLGVLTSGVLGIALGLIAGYAGGAVDTLIMRVADVQL
ncbi:ABC transporter permease, partial|nr:ABC transporter permease [Escherichia coli]